MKENDQQQTLHLLQSIMEYELAGVIRYNHFCLVVKGANRNLIIDFLKEQAEESLAHARKVGEILVSLNGHPKPCIAPVKDIEQYSVKDILVASLAHEQQAIEMYQQLLASAPASNQELVEFVRNMIEEEGNHHLELKQMIQDLS
ncbi:MAG: bacterioferritin [Calothrix sp. C42_A2020_038]|nr:bacterioferritin [Calothrix sp. C42_A2020_038]